MVKLDAQVIDQYQVAKRLGAMRKKAPNVIAKAINFTINDMRDLLGKKIQEIYAIRTSNFRKEWRKNRIEKATPSKPYAVINVRGKRLSMADFILDPNRRPKEQPNYYTGKFIAKQALRNLVANNGNKGFFATMKNGHKGIYYRISKSGNSRKIGELTAPSIPIMAGDEENVFKFIEPKINAILEKNTDKLIDRTLGG